MVPFLRQVMTAIHPLKKEPKSLVNDISEYLARNEYKLAIYTRYAIPSLRYCLPVYDLMDTQLKQQYGK